MKQRIDSVVTPSIKYNVTNLASSRQSLVQRPTHILRIVTAGRPKKPHLSRVILLDHLFIMTAQETESRVLP